jgi:hypothetical protein
MEGRRTPTDLFLFIVLFPVFIVLLFLFLILIVLLLVTIVLNSLGGIFFPLHATLSKLFHHF